MTTETENQTNSDALISKYEIAIRDIAPWLAASLSDPNIDACDGYITAVNAVLQCDELRRKTALGRLTTAPQ